MSEQENIRWIQRLNNYEKALNELKEEVVIFSQKEPSRLEKKGVIQSFEIIHELAWKVIKDFFAIQGETGIYGSRDAFQLAFKNGLIKNGSVFMESIKSRNLTSHTYDEKVSDEIVFDIINKYYDAFEELRESMLEEKVKREL
jgi:nucleotidyltransferase substrate binding protein (TIGR01987 family)